MDEAKVWRALLPDERKSVWTETENNFWTTFQREQAAEQAADEQAYQKATADIRHELDILAGQKAQLTETQQHLALELNKAEKELARIVAACNDKGNHVAKLEHEYQEAQLKRLAKRKEVSRTMRKFFHGKRGEEVESETESEIDSPIASLPRANHPLGSRHPLPHTQAGGQLTVNEQQSISPAKRTSLPSHRLPPIQAPASQASPGHGPSNVLVDIVSAEGAVLGAVERIDPWNQWVEAIQELQVKRPVMIRRGRKFNRDHVASIYDRSEAKGVKWLSCMIQATGEIQSQRCISCDKNQGAFEHCTIVGGALFQKCGNCEWNRQGCHRSTTRKVSSPPLLPPPHGLPEIRPAIPERIERVGYAETTAEARQAGLAAMEAADLRVRKQRAAQHALGKAAGFDGERRYSDIRPALQPNPESANRPPRQMKGIQILNSDPIYDAPQQMPTPKEPERYTILSGFTAANVRSRPPSRELATPTAMSTEQSPRLAAADTLPEITRATLVLRDNGTVYTYPECVQGVPLVKIDENHPYWDPKWPNVKSLVEPVLQSWRQKYEAALEAKANGEQVSSAKFQAGRQVNRGLKIMEFIDEGHISPYQLLSKEWIHTGKGAITSYDTLFRLCETLSELSKFNLDVTPVQWMRQRLYELMEAHRHGPSFNLGKIVHDFYHDPKLTLLRYKNGYKNIGRPSGLKMGPRNSSATSTPMKDDFRKRKTVHSQTGTPRETPSLEQSPLMGHEEAQFSNQMYKRAKTTSPTQSPRAGEFRAGDYLEADSRLKSPSAENEFRLAQVKTRSYTSRTDLQSWAWQESRKYFKHTLFKETESPSWDQHGRPNDFDVRVDDVEEVRWDMESLRLRLCMGPQIVSVEDQQPRGDVMASFEDERTLQRFLNCCRESKLKLTKEDPEMMERLWVEMKSKLLPGQDGEAGDERGKRTVSKPGE